MKQKLCKLFALMIVLTIAHGNVCGQQTTSMYGDAAKADVKMNYVYTMEEAFKQAREQKKPIFFNCFADWALPCHAMNKLVFSDQEFCDFMNKNFINLFMDLSKGENKPIADKYDVKSFAHHLVLDADGNILLRISGGKPKEEMKESVALALNPKTTLPAAEKAYNDGKRSKKDLLNYLNVLALAGNREQFNKVNAEYVTLLKPKEYAHKENWNSFTAMITDKDNEFFTYLIDHKADFVKTNGEMKVNQFIEGQYMWDVLNYALGQTPYDKMKVIELNNKLLKAELPDTCYTQRLYPLIQLRGEKRLDEMFDYLNRNSEQLGMYKLYIDTSLEFPDCSSEEKSKIFAYLQQCIDNEKNPEVVKQLKAFVYKLEHPNGIFFEKGTLAEVMAEAKIQGKILFVDCYTTWCGPCKRMASQAFVQESVGNVYNKRFINVKVDMEQKEGRELAKKYDVTAYPTLLFIDGDGKLIKKVVGAQNAEGLLKIASEIPHL